MFSLHVCSISGRSSPIICKLPARSKLRPALHQQQRASTCQRVRLIGCAQNRDDGMFNLQEYFEATVMGVHAADKTGQVLHLRLHDGSGSILPVYIGEFEGASITKELQNKKSPRPIVYDLFRNALEAVGSRVTRVCISSLVRNTYHARVHFVVKGAESQEFSIDSRPSDALNLALRFSSPIFVNKEIAYKMASSPQTPKDTSNQNDIARKCREELMQHQDPTVLLKLQLALHLQNDRFEDARRCQDQIDRLLQSDRLLGLMVSLEAALDDQRYEEAVKYRDELAAMRQQMREEEAQAQAEAETTGL